jgi:hypothetical protein
MKRYLLKSFPLAAAVWVAGCASTGVGGDVQLLAQLDDAATGAYETRATVVMVEGKPGILFATKDDRIAFQLGDKRNLLDTNARVKGGNRLQLNWQDKQLHATWWSHKDGKNVYLTSSADGGKTFGAVSMVNEDHGVLPPYTVTRGPNGVLGFTYHDERIPNYEVFFNRSTDFGKTWPGPDVRLDTPPKDRTSSDVHEPQTIEVGNTWLSTWTDNVREGGQTSFRIISRRSTDFGTTWSPAEVLFTSNHHLSSLIVRSQGDAVVVVADEVQRGVFALTSLDQGKTWRNAGIVAASEKKSNSGVDLALTNGAAHLVWMEQPQDEKIRIVRASLDIEQNKWRTETKRLDTKATDNTRSLSPTILATAKGVLMAAWVDSRDIRPNIYMAISYDNGVVWSEPMPIEKPGAMWAGWPQLYNWGEQVVLAYEIYPTDKLADGKLVVKTLPMGNSLQTQPAFTQVKKWTAEERKAKLEQRIKALWDYRVAGNYEPAYDFFDFVYKAATPKAHYLANSGVITYIQHAVDKMDIQGNVADVGMKVKYEMKPVMTPFTSKPIQVLPVEVEVPTTWVWVADDWYIKYAPSFEPPLLNY